MGRGMAKIRKGNMFIVCDDCSYRARFDAETEGKKARHRTRDHFVRLGHKIKLYWGSEILLSFGYRKGWLARGKGKK